MAQCDRGNIVVLQRSKTGMKEEPSNAGPLTRYDTRTIVLVLLVVSGIALLAAECSRARFPRKPTRSGDAPRLCAD